MENHFLHTVAELKGNLGFLMTDRFASHAIRVLLLALAGESFSDASVKSLLQSKKKEDVSVQAMDGDIQEDTRKRSVPKSFMEALGKLMNDSIAGLDTNGLRALATHQLGNPTLQLLVRLELTHFGKQKAKEEGSIIRTLFPEDPITSESETASFINGLLYDPVGSHLVETVVEYASGKMFKNLYKDIFKTRMGSLARNEIAGFVVCKVLDRLSREDLIEAHELILPTIPALIERGRFVVIKTLVQRCAVRKVDTQAIAVQMDAAFGSEDGFDILQLLHWQTEPAQNGVTNGTTAANGDLQTPQSAKTQGSMLAQAMILVPGPLSGLIFDSLPKLSPEILVAMSKSPTASRTLQAAMSSTNAGIIPRRKLVQQFYGNIGEMSLDRSASRVVDSIWEGTHGLAFIRERIAEELAENEEASRDSPCGRAVWRNWKMDLYKRRRNEWIMQSKNKASNDGFQSFSEVDKNKMKSDSQDGDSSTVNISKSPLELARERHAARRQHTTQRREVRTQEQEAA